MAARDRQKATTAPRDCHNISIGIASRNKYQDATGTPVVSPVAGTSLTLTPPSGATALHVACSLAIYHGEGTLAGTAGNGYAPAVADEWVTIPCIQKQGTSTLFAKTQAGGSGTWSFFFEINDGE